MPIVKYRRSGRPETHPLFTAREEREGAGIPAARWPRDGQDSPKGRLAAGVNRVLLKVTQGGGGWVASARITNPFGKPLRLEQRTLE
ncbi:MAG: hypothetical protein HY320_07495 [Armatimonadetes bacterium]|nr:hypothetical protein [Armatimonadota bacterium]